MGLRVRGRVVVEGRTVVDTCDGSCLDFDTVRDARGYARFLRRLLRCGIDFSLFEAPHPLDYPEVGRGGGAS